MKNNNVKLLCLAGLFTALVFVTTAYLHIPSYTGYVHIGDCFIFLAACLLPMPYAIFTGAAGAALADILTGFAIWAPGSIIVKAVTVLLFTRKTEKIVSVRNLLAILPALIVNVAGYYLYNALVIAHDFTAPIAEIPGNIVQTISSAILFIILGFALDKFKFKAKFLKLEN